MKRYLVLMGIVISIILLGFLCYLPALKAPFFVDDFGLVANNTIIRSLHNIHIFFGGGTFYGGNNVKLVGSFYRPLTVLYYAVVYHFFGNSPFHFHIIYITFHIINTLLVLYVFRRFLKNNTLAYLLALVFLVHPIQVETVTYISTHDILPFMFGMLAFIAVINNVVFIVPLILITIALLCKESTIIFFGIFVIYTYLFRRKKIIIHTLLLAALFIGYSLLRCNVGHICATAGDNSALTNAPIAAYLLNLPAIIFYYIKTFFYPAVLAHGQHWFIRRMTYNDFVVPLIGDFITGLLLSAGLLIVFARHYKNTNIQAPHKQYVFFCLWLVCGMLLYMHFVPVDFTVAEHWFYLPMVGLLGLIGVLINELSQKKRPIVYVLLVIVIIALGTRTYYRNIDWQDQYRLLLTDYPHSPDSYDIESNIGYELSHRGKIKEAIVYFKKATESAPSYPIGWYNLGTAYESLGDYSQALKYYTIAQKGQGFYLAYERYAYTLIKLNQHDKAKLFLTKTAIPKFPYNEKLKTILKQVDTAVPQQ